MHNEQPTVPINVWMTKHVHPICHFNKMLPYFWILISNVICTKKEKTKTTKPSQFVHSNRKLRSKGKAESDFNNCDKTIIQINTSLLNGLQSRWYSNSINDQLYNILRTRWNKLSWTRLHKQWLEVWKAKMFDEMPQWSRQKLQIFQFGLRAPILNCTSFKCFLHHYDIMNNLIEVIILTLAFAII